MKIPLLCAVILCCLLTGIVCAESPAYGNWTRLSADPGFSPRFDYGTAVFDGKLWVIGGHLGEGYLWQCRVNSSCETNEIWSSPDGRTWSLITGNAGFSPRSGHGVAVFRDRLFVIGGGTGDDLKNDVWSSHDGSNWTKVTGNATFSPRRDMGVAVYNDRLFVIGGGRFGNLNSDVWSSPDGSNWTKVTDNAAFGPRYGKGVAVLNNHLWIIGGTGDSDYTDIATGYTYLDEGGSKDVWSSEDGKTWKLVTAEAPFSRLELTTVAVFDHKLWIAGGGLWQTMLQHTKRTYPYAYNKVWSSPDGSNWTLETGDVGFSPRFLHGAVPFNNSLVVLGGTENYQLSHDVWYMPALSPEQTPVPVLSPTAVPATESAVPKTTPAKSGSPSVMACVSLLVTLGISGYCIRRGLRKE
jgi:hypothetical protein